MPPHTAGGNNAADGRVAMAPAWANVTFAGAYDFMLVADDEAVWDLSNVRALLSRLDPAEPLFLTDAAAPHPSHPHRFCVRPPAAAVVDAGARHGVPGGGPCTLYPSAAPCTVAALANRSLSPPPCLTKGVVNGWNTYAHGNAGFIASRGLLASVPPADWARCVDAARPRAGCDVIVGVCVVTLAGHGATRPHRDTRAHVFGGLPPGRWAQLARSLAAGDGAACGRPCRWLLTHSLSTFLPHDTRPNMAALLREWAGATAAARAVLGESPAGEAWDEPVW